MEYDSDIQLMLEFKKGDKIAFQKLFDMYKKRVINYCYRFCGNPFVAEDLAQETFIRVYKAGPRYDPKSRFSTWLFKIATNVCLNELRKPVYKNKIASLDDAEQVEQVELRDNGNTGADENIEGQEMQKMIMEAVQSLPENQRVALLLRVDQDFSYKEIGKQIKCNENHVKILIHRARKKLTDLIKQKKRIP